MRMSKMVGLEKQRLSGSAGQCFSLSRELLIIIEGQTDRKTESEKDRDSLHLL